MINAQNKYFCTSIFVSLMLHLFVLTILFTVPHPDKNDEYKRVRVKLGKGHFRTAGAMENAKKYASYNNGAGSYEQKILPGTTNNNIQGAEILDDSQQANKNSVPNVNEIYRKNIDKVEENKNRKSKIAKKRQPAHIKEIAVPNINREIYTQTAISDVNSLEPKEEEEGTIIGNSIMHDAEERGSYKKMLPLWLEKFKQYPLDTSVKSSGVGEIFIKIDRKGKILLSKIIKTTGSIALDKALAKMIADADPVLPVPSTYYPDKKTFSYKIAVKFESPKNDQ
jgi:outer membrane biosynthesis protein TonB